MDIEFRQDKSIPNYGFWLCKECRGYSSHKKLIRHSEVCSLKTPLTWVFGPSVNTKKYFSPWGVSDEDIEAEMTCKSVVCQEGMPEFLVVNRFKVGMPHG